MSPITTKGHGLVLVTGANGFIAARTVEAFLLSGYSVRGTVRSTANSQPLLDALKYYGDRFELVEVKDITAPGAFDEAIRGVDYVAHVAAPVSFHFTDPEPVLRAAVHGTTGILESAVKESSVKHFVLMSSIVSCLSPKETYRFTEKDWNTVAEAAVAEKGKDAGGYLIYAASKVAAEKALWKFRNERKPKFTVTALNPVFVAGPPLVPYPSPDKVQESAWMLRDVFFGVELDKAGLPSAMKGYVDVRDVARFVKYSVEHPAETDGERYILSAVSGPAQSVADILREAYPERRGIIQEGTPGQGYNLPGYTFPKDRVVDGGKARKLLGAYLPWEQTVVDTAKAFEHLS
ncbi:NAD(P)-binding protein [Coniochaeta ligniaria NRRL 30616]|uniref:NAD(P)-binding protein n=1 Tax=Coniochaeta ligniaria NRRL 30616 TaxID=1408157 RepID=A0A1J7IYZ1_9PEZI|nr:NAD(P)-binding protein [Coniochaeta ligniaria NRRL 30616]